MYDIKELSGKLLPELKEIAKSLNIKKLNLKKQDLIYKILDEQAEKPDVVIKPTIETADKKEKKKPVAKKAASKPKAKPATKKASKKIVTKSPATSTEKAVEPSVPASTIEQPKPATINPVTESSISSPVSAEIKTDTPAIGSLYGNEDNK